MKESKQPPGLLPDSLSINASHSVGRQLEAQSVRTSIGLCNGIARWKEGGVRIRGYKESVTAQASSCR